MAEYIEREAAKRHLVSDYAYAAAKMLDDIPTADVAPVVRCRECKHWHEKTGWCGKHSHFITTDDEFCHPWESAEWKAFAGDYFCKDGDLKGGEG